MRILEFGGIEMQKESKTSFQDYFNESFLWIEDQGKKRRFSIVYLRYFEEKMDLFTPFKENPILSYGDKEYHLRDVLALIYFLRFPKNRGRKRLYIPNGEDFANIFIGATKKEVEEMLIGVFKENLPISIS